MSIVGFATDSYLQSLLVRATRVWLCMNTWIQTRIAHTRTFAPTPLHARRHTTHISADGCVHDIGLNCVSHQVYSPRLNSFKHYIKRYGCECDAYTAMVDAGLRHRSGRIAIHWCRTCERARALYARQFNLNTFAAAAVAVARYSAPIHMHAQIKCMPGQVARIWSAVENRISSAYTMVIWWKREPANELAFGFEQI